VCGGGACAVGFDDCDGQAGNGCEVDLSSNVGNCGACGVPCSAVANGTPGCSQFQCGIAACDPGFADCHGGAVDGCETNLKTDVDNCNACGASCPVVANGSRTCDNGGCAIGTCATGFDDCDGEVSNGCEVDLTNDVAHCGSCGNACTTPPNGVAGCTASGCVLASCNAGYSNCDNDPDNGCERNTAADASNCGGCGITCGSGSCTNSACDCNKTVLVIPDGSTTGADTLVAALNSAGYTATRGSTASHLYDGTNPALTGYGAVIVLAGGPTSVSYATDMPAAGQTAIVDFVNAGNGLVLTEWAAYHVANGRWQTLAPLVLLTRTKAYTGMVTYTVDPGFATHPLWAGLSTSFTFASATNVGVTRTAANVVRVAGSAQAIDGVALRDAPVGRVVHVSHAGNYSPNGWTNTNIQKLMANAVGWTARCN
jgi:hypothetical protein